MAGQDVLIDFVEIAGRKIDQAEDQGVYSDTITSFQVLPKSEPHGQMKYVHLAGKDLGCWNRAWQPVLWLQGILKKLMCHVGTLVL